MNSDLPQEQKLRNQTEHLKVRSLDPESNLYAREKGKLMLRM